MKYIEDIKYFGNPDEQYKNISCGGYTEFTVLDIEDETKKDLEEMLLNCGWLREKKLLKIKSKIC